MSGLQTYHYEKKLLPFFFQRWFGTPWRDLEREPLEEVGDEEEQLHLGQTLSHTASATFREREKYDSKGSSDSSTIERLRLFRRYYPKNTNFRIQKRTVKY